MGYYGYNVAGDPGFFSFLGKAFKGIGKGVAAAATGIARGAAFVGRNVASALPTIASIGAPIVGGLLGGPIGAFAGNAVSNLFGGGGSGNAIPDFTYAGNVGPPGFYATPFTSAGAPIRASWEIPDTRPPIDMAYTSSYRDEEEGGFYDDEDDEEFY